MSHLKIVLYTLLVAALSVFSSCTVSPYYQKQEGVPGAQWKSDFKPVFEIEIPDSSYEYITYVIFRHGEDYPYSNLWLDARLKGPGEKEFGKPKKLEVILANADGKWLAKGMGGVWEHRIPLSFRDAPKFDKQGRYYVELSQLMRDESLPAIINIGLRVERLRKKK